MGGPGRALELIQAAQGGNRFLKPGNQVGHVRQGVAACDHNGHQLARAVHPGDQAAHAALFAVEGRDGVIPHPLPHDARAGQTGRVLNQAARRARHRLILAAKADARPGFAVRHHGVLGLVAEGEGSFHADRRAHLGRLEPADPLERGAHHLALEVQRGLIGHVPRDAAAAEAVVRAVALLSAGGGGQHADEARLDKALALPDQLGLDRLARQRAGHERRPSVRPAAHALQLRSDSSDVQLHICLQYLLSLPGAA